MVLSARGSVRSSRKLIIGDIFPWNGGVEEKVKCIGLFVFVKHRLQVKVSKLEFKGEGWGVDPRGKTNRDEPVTADSGGD